MKFSKTWRGSVSIFLCLILLPMVTYSTMIIDATRLQTSRSTIASAGDLAMNAALSEYEQTLEDMYGLFAVSKSPEDLKKHLGVYFTETIESKLFNGKEEKTDIDTEYLANSIVNAIFSGTPTDDLTNLIELKVDNFDYDVISGSTLANQAIMKKQIIEYMKYKGPVSLVNTLVPKLDFLKDSSKQTEVVEKKIKYTQTLNKLQEVCLEAWKEIQGERDDKGNFVNDNHGYNEEAKKFNESHGGFDVNDCVNELNNEYLPCISEELLMNKDIYSKEKFPEWGELTTEEAVEKFKTDNGIEINIPEWGEEKTIDKAEEIMNYIAGIYMEILPFLPFDVAYNETAYVEINDEIISSVESSINVLPSVGDDKSIAYKGRLDEYSNSMNLDSLDTVSYNKEKMKSNLEILRKYYENQIKAYNAAQLFKDNLQNVAAAWVISNQLSVNMEIAFGEYKELVNAEVEAGVAAAIAAEIAAIEKEEEEKKKSEKKDKDKKEESEEESEEESTEETTEKSKEERIEEKREEETKRILGLYSYYDFKLKNTIIKGINQELVWTGYKNSVSTFVNKVNDRGGYYLNEASRAYNCGCDSLNIYYRSLQDIVNSCSYVISALENIEREIGTTESAKRKWSDKVEELSDGSTKSTMKSDLETTTDGLNKEDVTALKDVVKKVETDFQNRRSELKEIKFLDVSVIDNYNFVNRFKYNEVFEKIIDGDISGTASKIVEGNFKRVEFPEGSFLAEILDGNPAKDGEKPVEIFYTTLKSICEPFKPEVKEEKKKEQKDKVDKINEAAEANEDGTPKADIPKITDGGEETDKKEAEIIDKANGQTIGEIYEEIAKESKVEKKADTNENKANGGGGFSFDGDYDSSASNATGSLTAATKILKELKRIGKEAINDAYLEEYFTEMFTCRTDPVLAKKGKNISFLNGYSIPTESKKEGIKAVNANTAWYGNEVEYILWGNDDFEKNRMYTDSWIYVVRFALNAIYAFTAADIQAFALEVATVIAGWTVIGVPIVQACITVAIAMAESAYDLKLLHEGADVPIYKNASNFVCSPAGLTKEVAERVTEKIIDKAAETVKDTINSQIDALGEKAYTKMEDALNDVNKIINDYVKKELETVETAITNQFVTPIINSVSNVFTTIDTSISDAENAVNESIKNAVDDAWEKIDKNIDEMNDGLIKKYTKIIYKNVDADQKQKDLLIKKIQGCFSNYVNGARIGNPAEDLRVLLTDEKEGMIPQWFDTIRGSVEREIKSQVDTVKDEIKDRKDEGLKNIKSIVSDKIDSVSSSIGSSASKGVGEAIDRVKKPTISLSKDKADTVTSGGFTLNYKEYCKIMMCIKLLSSESEGKLLNRAATLMQANVITAADSTNTKFKMSKAYTLIGVKATVRMGTLFPWAVEINDETDVDGSLGAKSDFSSLGKYEVKIKYNAVNGY